MMVIITMIHRMIIRDYHNEDPTHQQGLLNVPFWVYWTSPYSSHLVDHIPNGWVMFNGDI